MGGRDTPSGPFCVTLVVDLPIAKPDALEVIAFVSDGAVENARTAFPRVGLAPNVWAEVQIPRFADPRIEYVDVEMDEEVLVSDNAEHLIRRFRSADIRPSKIAVANADSHDVLATFHACAPIWATQPKMTSSTSWGGTSIRSRAPC